MKNQRSSSEQMLLFLMLAFGAMMIWQQMHPSKGKGQDVVPDRPALTLARAFAGIDPAQGPLLTPVAAKAQKTSLEADIKANPKDPKAAWDNLRLGLLEQYVLAPKDPKSASTFYDANAKLNEGDAVQAQAYYQKGDFLWHLTGGDLDQTRSDAVQAFENLIHRGRGASKFIDNQIYVASPMPAGRVAVSPTPTAPVVASSKPMAQPVAVVATAVAPHFTLLKVADLHGTLEQPDPNGILDRLDSYYSAKPLYVVFNSLVRLLGDHPTWSVGVALLVFAFFTRFVMQPLNKKQYEAMKGMAVIAPEMKKIQEKYKGKPEQQVQQMKEIQALQKAHGVNPMMGCGLALLQMPIFFLVVYPLINEYSPRIQLMGASFLWVHNLSQPDIALLLLYAFSMFVSMRLSSMPATDDMQRQQQMMMSYVMPIMFPFMLKGYPSAFILYWMTFNVLSMYFQYHMMKAANPEKTLMSSLFGSGAPPAAGKSADAVPARPKNTGKEGQVKSLSASSPSGGAKGAAGSAKKPHPDASSRQNGSANGSGANEPWAELEEGGQIETEAVTSGANGQFNGGAPAGAPESRKPGNAQRARRRRRY